MITVRTNHGEFRGRSVESVIRTQYGKKAYPKHTADPNNHRWGEVLRPNPKENGYDVLATIISVEDDGPSALRKRLALD
ncbi:hypothetical protein [Nocardia sp. NPDC057440]|uniref:hypothetical protein n=1 Tax=Nocardia sp. NPDC057440 TaxID=3346134 RepID=UPI0036731CA2